MYGYTPPAVIAVEPSLLDGDGPQRIAHAFASRISRRPAWIVTASPHEPTTPRSELDAARSLQERLESLAVGLPIEILRTHHALPRRAAAIVPGALLVDGQGKMRRLGHRGCSLGAALIARRLGGREVILWRREGGLRVGNVPIPEVDAHTLGQLLTPGEASLEPGALRMAIHGALRLTIEDPERQYPATLVATTSPSRPVER